MPTITISAAEAAEGDELLQQISIENYAFVAAAALITYEHFLVMKQEIELISDHKITSVACILLNRLSMTGIAVTNVLLMLPWSNPTSCAILQITYDTFRLMITSVSIAVAAIRVYVVSGKNWHLVVPTILLGLVPIGTNITLWSKSLFNIVLNISSSTFCANESFVSIMAQNRMEIVTRSCAIASEIFVVVVTWIKMYNSVQIIPGHSWLTLPMLLLQDGTSYFFALFILNIVQLVLWLITSNNVIAPDGIISGLLYPLVLLNFSFR